MSRGRSPAVARPSQQRPPGFFSLVMLALSVTFMAAITSVMLFLNGSLTLFALHWIVDDHPEWAERRSIFQFVLFTVPLLLVVAEWFAWDLLRGSLTRENRQ
ncbi:hypothetical protein [Roseiconus lacunae]|uniref:hypothetical protein n=1 Tax=Roseiconus lacunae TaxID=2605694 RepID=UPI0011F30978|nr:hypothetical protein [Roseiconus lacunae]